MLNVLKRLLKNATPEEQEQAAREILKRNPALYAELMNDAVEEEASIEVTNWPVTTNDVEQPALFPTVDQSNYTRYSPAGELEYFCQGHNQWHAATEFRNDYNPGQRGGHASCRAYYDRNRKKPSQSSGQTEMVMADRSEAKKPIMTRTRQLDSIAPEGFLGCATCGVLKPISEFDRDRSKTERGGRHTQCKKCKREEHDQN